LIRVYINKRKPAEQPTGIRDGKRGSSHEAVVCDRTKGDVKNLTKELVQHKPERARFSSSGAYCAAGNHADDRREEDRLAETLNIIKSASSRREVLTTASYALPGSRRTACIPRADYGGRETVFVVDVEQIIKLKLEGCYGNGAVADNGRCSPWSRLSGSSYP
jgi:uncharacterized protein YaaQ